MKRLVKKVKDEFEAMNMDVIEEKINQIAEMRVLREIAKRSADDPVPGHHFNDNQRTSPIRNRIHVPG